MTDTRAEDTGAGPVFVFGALRSGTTLLRVMLKAHPGLQSPGEADFLFDHLIPDADCPSGWAMDHAALARDRIFRAKEIGVPQMRDGLAAQGQMIDAMAAKAPGRLFVSLHRHAPRLAALWPDAPVIHLLRDPRDVARSSIGMGWAGNSFHGVAHWIETERGWDGARIDPRLVHTLSFEDLMADTEAELSRICAHLGLRFHPAMRTYWEGTTYGPPKPQTAAKWQGGASAREVARIEGRVGDLLARRGYKAAGDPVHPGPAERAWLATESRLKRWRHNARRYGTGLFLGQHAARVLGLKGLSVRLAKRQEDIRIRNLQ